MEDFVSNVGVFLRNNVFLCHKICEISFLNSIYNFCRTAYRFHWIILISIAIKL